MGESRKTEEDNFKMNKKSRVRIDISTWTDTSGGIKEDELY